MPIVIPMDKQQLVTLLKECQALQYGHFVLTSGAVSDYYVDLKKACTSPTVLHQIAKEMNKHTKAYDLIAGMELGAVPLAVALSLESSIPYVIVRKQKREHGTGKQIEGPDVRKQRVLIVEDVTTSGGSVVQTINILRQHDAIVDHVISVVDRQGGAKEKIEQLNVQFTPLLTVEDIKPKK